MDRPLISIIIPTYNRAYLLARAIRSALGQAGVRTQVIVVDDGSTDDTRQVVDQFAAVEYYYQANRGQAAARNLGLRHAQGSFIASLDSDDYWEPDFLRTGLHALEKHDLDFVFLNWREDTGAESYLAKDARKPDWQRYQQRADGEWWLLDAALVRRLFVSTCPSPSSALVIRRSSLPGGWNEQMLIADDWHLMRNLVLQGPARAAFTLAPHWTKCVQDDNIYDGRAHLEIIQRLGFHDEQLMAELFAPYLTRPEMRQIRQRLAMHYFSYSYFDWKLNGTSPATFSKLARAFRLAPLTAGRLSVLCVAQYFYTTKGHLGPFPTGRPSVDAQPGRAPAQQLAARPVQDAAGA